MRSVKLSQRALGSSKPAIFLLLAIIERTNKVTLMERVCVVDSSSSLFGSSFKGLDKLAVDDHLFGEAAVDALFLVHVQLFRLEGLDAVVETLGTRVEKEARRRLKVHELSIVG